MWAPAASEGVFLPAGCSGQRDATSAGSAEEQSSRVEDVCPPCRTKYVKRQGPKNGHAQQGGILGLKFLPVSTTLALFIMPGKV